MSHASALARGCIFQVHRDVICAFPAARRAAALSRSTCCQALMTLELQLCRLAQGSPEMPRLFIFTAYCLSAQARQGCSCWSRSHLQEIVGGHSDHPQPGRRENCEGIRPALTGRKRPSHQAIDFVRLACSTGNHLAEEF